MREGAPAPTLGITSCRGGQGVSTTATCLAWTAAAQHATRVLLVDCHFAKPSVHREFALEPGSGLAECLCDDYPLHEAIRPAAANLSILPAGQLRGSPRGPTIRPFCPG